MKMAGKTKKISRTKKETIHLQIENVTEEDILQNQRKAHKKKGTKNNHNKDKKKKGKKKKLKKRMKMHQRIKGKRVSNTATTNSD